MANQGALIAKFSGHLLPSLYDLADAGVFAGKNQYAITFFGSDKPDTEVKRLVREPLPEHLSLLTFKTLRDQVSAGRSFLSQVLIVRAFHKQTNQFAVLLAQRSARTMTVDAAYEILVREGISPGLLQNLTSTSEAGEALLVWMFQGRKKPLVSAK